MRNLVSRQRAILVVGLVAVAVAVVLFITPVGSAPAEGTEGAQEYCGRVVKSELDSGECGSKLASRRTLAWSSLVAGAIVAGGGIWALRPDDVSHVTL